MNHELQVILHITVAVATALMGGLIAYRLRQSPLIGYLFAGMIIGPFTSGFVADREQIAVLAEVGVIFLMFALGIEFSTKELMKMKGPAIAGTLAQVLLTLGAGVMLGVILGWPLLQSVFFGSVISISSTMVILKNLMNRGEMTSNHGRLMLAMLIVQDLAVVVMILLLPKIAQSSDSLFVDVGFVLLKALGFIGATLLLGMRVVPKLMQRVEQLRSPELFLLTAVTLALVTATASAMLGLSPALGAFMGGLMLTETEFDHRVISELIPMRDLFATLFFVSIGMLIDVRFIISHWPAVLGMACFIVVAKWLATTLALLPFRVGGKTLAFSALGMTSIGEFNYVLAQVGRTAGAIPTDLYNLILSSSLLTIVLTPAAFWVAPRLDRVLGRAPLLGKLFAPRLETPPLADDLKDHAIIVGYGRVGKRMARGLRQAGLKVVVIEQEMEIVRELNAAGRAAIYGDASYEIVLAAARPATARVIVVALPDFGATRAVVHRARSAGSNALIVARAQRSENDARLREAGATAVVVPENAGALMLLEETLILLDLPHEHIFTGISPLAEMRRITQPETNPESQLTSPKPAS